MNGLYIYKKFAYLLNSVIGPLTVLTQHDGNVDWGFKEIIRQS